MAAQLRCRVCGGVAFDCACWRVSALEAECDRVERGGIRSSALVARRQLEAAKRLLSQAKAEQVRQHTGELFA